jgi:hypothetical protein
MNSSATAAWHGCIAMSAISIVAVVLGFAINYGRKAPGKFQGGPQQCGAGRWLTRLLLLSAAASVPPEMLAELSIILLQGILFHCQQRTCMIAPTTTAHCCAA